MTYEQLIKYDPAVEDLGDKIHALLLSKQPFIRDAILYRVIDPELKRLAWEKRVPFDWYFPARGKFMRMLERGRLSPTEDK